MPTIDQLVDAFAEGVAWQVGFYKQTRRGHPLPVARKLNNPGCLTYFVDLMTKQPMSTESGFVEFSDLNAGWAALKTVIRANLIRKTLSTREFFRGRRGAYGGFTTRNGGDDVEAIIAEVLKRVQMILGVIVHPDDPVVKYSQDTIR